MHLLKRELKTIILIIITAAVTLLILVGRERRVSRSTFAESLPGFITPTPTTTPPEKITNSSPDGSRILTLKKQKINNVTTYSFFTSEKSTDIETLVFKKTVDQSQNLTVPFNAWSPNHAYFFIKEATPSANSYLVFSASGKPLADNSQYLNIQELFTNKLPQFTLTDITGWADPGLLILNTKTDKGEPGPSFWFDLASKSFIQLGTRFN